jgi:hypothetical protein
MKGIIMTEETNNVAALPSKSVFTKTNAIRVGVAALAVVVAVVVVVKLKTSPVEIADALSTEV